MFKKLFVGGLPFAYTDDELRALFAPAGQIASAAMVHDPDRGRTRGFGFVEMSTPEEAQAAIAALNGRQVGEKKIFVTEARDRKPKPEQPAPQQGAPGQPARKPFPRKGGRNDRQERPATGAYPAWPPRSNTGTGSPYYRQDRGPRDPGQAPPRDRVPGAFGHFRKGPPREPGRNNDTGRRPFGRGPERPDMSGGFPRRDDAGRRPFGRGPERPDNRPGGSFPRRGPGRSDRPFQRGPGGFGGNGPGKGFSRPASQGDAGPQGRRSFTPPRDTGRGDFGPSQRGPQGRPPKPFGKSPRRSDAPPKKEFWRKFDKNKPS